MDEIKRFFIQLPGTMFVGVTERGACGSATKAEVVEPAPRTRQSAFDFTQRLRPGQLCEEHGGELIPTGESFTAFVRFQFTDEVLKPGFRDVGKGLCEQACGSYDGRVSHG